MEEQIAASLCCSGATPLVGERPRSNGQTTAWPAAPSRACIGEFKVMRAPLRQLVRSGRGEADPVPESVAAAASNRKSLKPNRRRRRRSHTSIFRRARFFGTHAPRDKENQPEMPERKHAGAPDAVLARPLSLASYPVATGRPRPGDQRPRARVRAIKEVNAGPMLFWRDPSRWRATP